MKIYKYPLIMTDIQQIKIPIPCQFLSFQFQDGKPVIWAAVDDLLPGRYVTIVIKGTAHELELNDLHYIGTAQGGPFVCHAFYHRDYKLFKNQQSLLGGEMKDRTKELALELLEWIEGNISRLQYELEELKTPLKDSPAYKKLTDSLRNGMLASYSQEFGN